MSTTPRSQTQDPCCAPDCCADDTPSTSARSDASHTDTTTLSADDLRQVVRQKYGDIAMAGSSGGCGCSSADLESLGYSTDQASVVPDGADLGLGCGNPLQHALPQVGETVLDLGSGAGVDAFLAAREVGDSGRVIGVDMTPAMLERARDNARKLGSRNVEFRLGEIEHLPVANDSVDVIISNCVINLSPDKPSVFAEALRALRPGGRLVVSDLVLRGELPEDIRSSVTAYIGCVAGASTREDYLRLLEDAGFDRIEVVEEKRYAGSDNDAPHDATLQRALEWSRTNVVSMKVRAWKPSPS